MKKFLNFVRVNHQRRYGMPETIELLNEYIMEANERLSRLEIGQKELRERIRKLEEKGG